MSANDPSPRRLRAPLVLLLWSTAFGFLEAVVVVYLRQIYYPNGFSFPLVPIPPRYAVIEIAREAATLILLGGVAHLVSFDRLRRFAAFAFCFGIWDLVFYLALKALLGWPASLTDWDILFLIPMPWTGPVLAPILVSLALVGSGLTVLLHAEENPLRLRPRDWIVWLVAAFLILGAFLWNVPAVGRQARPEFFPWWLFLAGLLPGLTWFVYKWHRRLKIDH